MCCTINKGGYLTKKDSRPGMIPVILGGQQPAYYIDKANHYGDAIVISRSGASAGFLATCEEAHGSDRRCDDKDSGDERYSGSNDGSDGCRLVCRVGG